LTNKTRILPRILFYHFICLINILPILRRGGAANYTNFSVKVLLWLNVFYHKEQQAKAEGTEEFLHEGWILMFYFFKFASKLMGLLSR